tara:strand:+ start:1735 stop:2205 length:471 start_codon:yes stop_codon:yes gene_type:complete
VKVVENALGKYIRWKLGKLNGGLDWERLAVAVGVKANDEKSIVIKTTNTDSTFSFQYSDRSLEWLDYAPLEPTVLMRCTDKVFRAIITGKIGVDQAFYGNLVELEGANLLREKFAANVLFDAFFTEEGYVKFAKTGNERRYQQAEEDSEDYEPAED